MSKIEEEMITYNELLEFFEQQREIEFTYKEKSYAFLSVKDGFVLVCMNKIITPVYEDYSKLAHEACIDKVLFLELFQNDQIEITTIF